MDDFVPEAVRKARQQQMEQLVRDEVNAHLLGDLEERLKTDVTTRLALSHFALMGSVSPIAIEAHRRASVARAA